MVKKFFDVLVTGILVGLIVSLTVSYLLSTPVISLKNTVVMLKDDKIDIGFQLENEGKSPAINVSMKFLYGMSGDKPEDFILKKSTITDRIEIGEVFSYKPKDLPLNKDNAIILMQIKFEDTSKVRENFNKKLSGNPYKINKLLQYIKGKEALEGIYKKQKDKYEKELLNRLK